MEATVRVLGAEDEVQVLPAQVVLLAVGAADDDERAGDVVDAVPVLATDRRQVGVFVETARIGEVAEVVEGGGWEGHEASASAAVTSRAAIPR